MLVEWQAFLQERRIERETASADEDTAGAKQERNGWQSHKHWNWNWQWQRQQQKHNETNKDADAAGDARIVRQDHAVAEDCNVAAYIQSVYGSSAAVGEERSEL